jgi:hypothetical protein
MTNITSQPTMIGILEEFGKMNSYVFFGLLLLSLFLIFIITFKKAYFKEVFLAGTFFVSVLGVRFFALGWITMGQLTIPIVCLFIAIMVFIIDKN